MPQTKFLSLIDEIIKNAISDLHISSNKPPYIRNKTGDISPVESYGVVSHEECLEIAKMLIGEDFTVKTRDVSFSHRDSRFRVNISETIDGITMSFRSIPNRIPSPEEILLPDRKSVV